MSQTRNLFLTGPTRVGKSTALRRALELLPPELEYDGFKTYHALNERAIHIARYRAECRYTPDNQIGRWGGKLMLPVPEVLEAWAAELRGLKDRPLLVMDELGFLEKSSLAFQQAVFELLAADVPVIGVLRQMDIPWQKPILADPGNQIVEVTAENRDQLPEQLAAWLNARL